MDNQNQNQQTPPGCIVAFVIFFIIAAIVNIMTDSIMLGMIVGAASVGVGIAILFGLKTFWDKADKKKLKKWSIIVGSSVVGILIAIGIANACIPTLSQEEIKTMVISELDSQVENVKSKLGISELNVELEIYDYTYEKPTIFSKGYIRFEVDDYYVSTQFEELDKGEYNETTCNKYRNIDSLEYDDVEIPKYRVYISRRSSYSDTEFKDSSGDEYSFDYGVIYKNGSYAYGGKKSYSSSSSSSSYKSSSGTKCIICNGSGYVRYYSGMYDEGTVGPCTSCGGDGRD